MTAAEIGLEQVVCMVILFYLNSLLRKTTSTSVENRHDKLSLFSLRVYECACVSTNAAQFNFR